MAWSSSATWRVSGEWQTQAPLVNLPGHFQGLGRFCLPLSLSVTCLLYICAVMTVVSLLAHLGGMSRVGREWQTQPVFSLSCSRGSLRDVSSVTHLIVSALRTRRATLGGPCFARRTWHSVGSWQWSVGVQNDFVALGPTSEFACILSFITSTSFIVPALWMRNANFGHTALHATYLGTSRTTSEVTIGSTAD